MKAERCHRMIYIHIQIIRDAFEDIGEFTIIFLLYLIGKLRKLCKQLCRPFNFIKSKMTRISFVPCQHTDGDKDDN